MDLGQEEAPPTIWRLPLATETEQLPIDRQSGPTLYTPHRDRI